jgi:hypothetical protein
MNDSRGDAEARRELDEITGIIIDAGVKLDQALGPGLWESVYEVILARDLERRGLSVEGDGPCVWGGHCPHRAGL